MQILKLGTTESLLDAGIVQARLIFGRDGLVADRTIVKMDGLAGPIVDAP